jgi:hypothetical protein
MNGLIVHTLGAKSADSGSGDFLATGGYSMATGATKFVLTMRALNSLVLPQGQGGELIVRQQPHVATFEERIFDALVSLKVSASFLSMHLSADERHRLFDALDETINVDDWHEGDKLPAVSSFQEFLRWMIYSRNADWTSIGVSENGTILVAWRKERSMLTADFEGGNSVRWTVRLMGEDGEVGHAAGRCPLKLFAEQAGFYLRR